MLPHLHARLTAWRRLPLIADLHGTDLNAHPIVRAVVIIRPIVIVVRAVIIVIVPAW
jgi:hypothetical protein